MDNTPVPSLEQLSLAFTPSSEQWIPIVTLRTQQAGAASRLLSSSMWVAVNMTTIPPRDKAIASAIQRAARVYEAVCGSRHATVACQEMLAIPIDGDACITQWAVMVPGECAALAGHVAAVQACRAFLLELFNPDLEASRTPGLDTVQQQIVENMQADARATLGGSTVRQPVVMLGADGGAPLPLGTSISGTPCDEPEDPPPTTCHGYVDGFRMSTRTLFFLPLTRKGVPSGKDIPVQFDQQRFADQVRDAARQPHAVCLLHLQEAGGRDRGKGPTLLSLEIVQSGLDEAGT